MLVLLNGYPGVGKLTIGKALATLLGGQLLDNHSVYNVAFALTEFRSDAFYDTVKSVQAIADARIAELSPETPLVLTEALAGQSEWGDHNWNRIVRLADLHGPLHVVHLHCGREEHQRRIQHADRAAKRKPQDPDMATRTHDEARPLLGADWPRLMRLDVTNLSADTAAAQIAARLKAEG